MVKLMGGQGERPVLGGIGFMRPATGLLDFLITLLPVALTRQRFFGSPLFTWLQIEGVSLDLLNDVFLLNLAFKPAQGAL